MIKLTNILPENKSNIRQLQLILTLLFLTLFAFPLFPLKVTNAILIILSFLTMIAYFIKPFPVGKIILHNLVFILPFIPFLLEFFISGFDPTARFEFEKKLFFFTAPITIPILLQLTGIRNYKIGLLIFSFSVILLTLYTIIILFYKGIPFNSSAYENGAYILRLNFEQVSGLHPTYYSVFALTSACFLIQSSAIVKGSIRLLFLLLAVILFISVLFLAVRIAFITAAILLLFSVIKSNLTLIKKLILGLLAMVLLVLMYFSIPSLNNRLNEISSWEMGQDKIGNTVSQRATILNCSLNVFSANILWGTGSRNFQRQLNNCYCSENWLAGSEQNFNSHNQYLSLGINYGLFIMLLFLICLFIIFRRIFKTPEGKYFGLAILIFFLSESMLERQMGVYFFGLISLLIYNINPNERMNHITESEKV